MKMEITIEKIEKHAGNEFKGTNWKSPMQVIYTDKGLFIDNDIGKCFKKWRTKLSWEGIDWNKYVGQKKEILVVDCNGNEKTSLNYIPVLTIKRLMAGIDNHRRFCPNHNWANPIFL